MQPASHLASAAYTHDRQLMGGCEQQPIRETTIQIEPCFIRSSSILDWIELHSEHSGIWSGASGDGGQSGGCRHLGCGRCCQRAGGLCSSRRQHCDHRGQLSSRPNSSSISASTSLVISIARQKHGMLGQPQQRVGLGHGPRPHCRSAGMASAQNTLTATAPRCPPRHRGNSPSAARIVAIRRRFDAHPVVAHVGQPGHQRELGP